MYPIELKLGMIILDINLHNPEQDFLHGKELRISICLRTSFILVPLSRRRRNLYLLDLRDDRSVRSALFHLQSFFLVLLQYGQ